MKNFTRVSLWMMTLMFLFTVLLSQAQKGFVPQSEAEKQVHIKKQKLDERITQKPVSSSIETSVSDVENIAGEKVFSPQGEMSSITPNGKNVLTLEDIYNAKEMSTIIYDPSKYPPVDQGGEDISSAFVISSLPFSATGTTSGYTDDYDEVCPYSGSTSPDVVYAYTPAADGEIDITLCSDLTAYDTKLYVYDISNPVTGDAIACNDDFCTTALSSYVSEILGVPVLGGTTYYIVVDGYGGASGDYEISVTDAVVIPTPECPAGAIWSAPLSTDLGAATSDIGPGYKAYNYFSGMGEITEIHWWGLSLYNDGAAWSSCIEDPRNFEIAIYDNVAGAPGTQTSPTYSALITGTPSGFLVFGAYEAYEYSFTLPAAFTQGSGWISIQGNPEGDPLCWFLWDATDVGTTLGLQETTPGTYTPLDYPLSMCLLGTEASCPSPVNLTTTDITMNSAKANWDEAGTASMWNLEYGPAGFSPGSGTLVTGITVVDPPFGSGLPEYDFTGLTEGTAYDWYVQADCGTDIESDWVGPQPFTTLFPIPANDECVDAEAVMGPYPQVVTGTTNGATVDCPGVLDWDAVWYTIDLPYGFNYVELDLCLDIIEYSYNFDALTPGGYVADQLGGMWTTWGGNPGTAEDAMVTTTQSNSASNSFVVDATSVDVIYQLGPDPIDAGQWWYSNYIYVPSGNSGYFNVQSDPTPGVAWVVDLFFDDGGTGALGTSSTETFTYSQDAWVFVEIYFDLDADLISVFLDGVLIDEFAWSGTIGGIDYFGLADGGTPGAFYDDVIFKQATTLVNTGIILTSDCSCDPASFIYSTGEWSVMGNCINELNFNIEGPATVYYPVTTDPKGNFTFDVNVTELGAPVADIDPGFFDVTLQEGATASGDLMIGNSGGYPLDYEAEIFYTGVTTTTVQVGPQASDYWTGTCDATTKTEVSQINVLSGGAGPHGWAQFDLSGTTLPPGATITGASLNWFINTQDCPYFFITDVAVDPVTAAAADLFAAITGGTLYADHSYCPGDGWNSISLNGDGITDLQTNWGTGVFALGFYEYEGYGSYAFNADGWAEANPPYLEITYTEGAPTGWLSIDGGPLTNGMVFPGDPPADIFVEFETSGFPIGSYSAEIHVNTNEPDPLDALTHIIPVDMDIVAPGGYNLSGNVTYANGVASPLYSVMVEVMDGAVSIASGMTDNNGDFLIPNVLDGSYMLRATTNLPTGGIDVSDINLQLDHILSTPISGLPFDAGDVTMDATINVNDVNELIDYILGTDFMWAAPNYVFDAPPIVVSGGDIVQDFQGLCSGDVDASFTPPPPPILSESFNGGIPGTWTVVDGFTDGFTWEGVTDDFGNTLDGTPFAFVDSDAAGSVDMDEELITPVFDGTGYSALTLEFDQYFLLWSTPNEVCDVDVWDGSAWQNVYTNSATIGGWGAPDHQMIDISAFANANMQVRFHYYNANYDFYWAVDNVQINGTP